MTVEYDVRIAERTHRICIEIPAGCDRRVLKEVPRFVITTALLVDSGYLPRGVIHAIA
jgi:hypothetical protein